MNNKEKLPKLVDVYRPSNPLSRRQLPLVVDENLTLVMDVKSSGIICDNQLFKSVERLYFQLFKFGHPTLDPLMVKPDGTITIKEDKQAYQVLGSIFHDHAVRLAKLIENQPKRNKKSVRCLLHSLDSQRSRPLTPVWRDVWDCMKPDCKKDVCIIEASSLHSTLERTCKHRFCGECRTKVLKDICLSIHITGRRAQPAKEKGYVSSLYSGIKRCLPDKHIHLQTKTDYITKLISRAEPNFWEERHAKTLEIAQEEECVRRECTCQVFAAVAVHTLSRSFETAVERIRGVSQLELLYAEFAREEQQKQIRKEQKKIKRKRKRVRKTTDQENKVYNDCDADEEDKDDVDKECLCTSDKNDSMVCYSCDQLSSSKNLQCGNELDEYGDCSKLTNGKKDKLRCTNELWIDDCKCENDVKENKKNGTCKCDNYAEFNNKKENGSTSDHSHDCGYSSENNNGCCETGSLISSLSSSPEGSELACSDTCCQHDTDFITHCRLSYGGNGTQLSLQEMLESHSDDDDECYITAEEVREFKSKSRQVFEKRQELREILQNRFAQFCVNGPVPRLLIQTKYASN
ncbi:hypothetical protein NQ317_013780 [Molorchus minor]|uniref:Uncharacterized protein n=1 Tax=Molorchus minor TaxID=1323400 RepID=A0ABQ9IVZ1_9CUCU|nr:hypothetical protein NQ317_013780 [Molorchus minor]